MDSALRGLLISYIFLFGIVILGELIRKMGGWQSVFTRKFIHIGVGFWGFLAYWTLYPSWIVLIPPVSFIAINLLSYKWTLFKSMEIEDKTNLGTVFYPFSLCILLVLFWRTNLPSAALIGLLVMALGDGFATIVGQKWGKHKYHIGRKEKTIEGSMAMFGFSFIAVVMVSILITDIPLSLFLFHALAIACIVTITENVTPWGLDNITVPLIGAAGYWLLFYL